MSKSPLESVKDLVLTLSPSDRLELYQYLVALPKRASERGVFPVAYSEKVEGMVELKTQWDCVVENGEVVYSLEGQNVFRARFFPETYVDVCFEKLKNDALVITVVGEAKEKLREELTNFRIKQGKSAPTDQELDIMQAEVLRLHTEQVLKSSLEDLAGTVSDNLPQAVAAILARVVSAFGFSVANNLRETLVVPQEKISAADAMKVVYGSEWQQIKSVLGIGPRGGSDPRVELSDAQCDKLSTEYPSLLTHWQKVVKHSRTEKNWRAYAKIDQPDTPDDLLNRLDSTLEQEPSKEDYPAIPSVLALEHAARRCGIPDNEYSSSRLKSFRQRGDAIQGQSKTED